MNRVVPQVQARKLLVNFHFQELRLIYLLALTLLCICPAIDVEDIFLQFHIRLNYFVQQKTHLGTLPSGPYFDF